MLSDSERRNLIDKIRSLPNQLAEAVKGLSEDQLETPYRDGGWTVRQVVHHLADAHVNAYIRMRLVVTEDHPTLKPYSQDDWARLPDARGDAIDESMELLKGLHARWSSFLQHQSAETWQRTAYHPEEGDVSLEQLVRIYAGHGENHVGQILRLRSARNW
ncbi:MAG TPA: putative metal-dependent hydrolase [candidate division Zixibacteria bacterium]|nr:putative metal-dependent hydrolase [candidate division Zixibacteria bacterium]